MNDTGRAGGVRARVRAEMIDEIKRIARDHLAADGANLSLRAVARDLGIVSSGVYRYFASRDDLLTALIIDAYDDLGGCVERAEAAVPRRDLVGRWTATGRALRAWAHAHPHEYALLYGSPVPGYVAPEATIGSAARVTLVLIRLLRDGVEAGVLSADGDRLPRTLRADLARVATDPQFGGVPEAVLARGITAWVQLFGSISFELWGHLVGAITDYDTFAEHQLTVMGRYVGLIRTPSEPGADRG